MDELKLYAVAGNPVLHSKHPGMFRHAFAAAGMNAVYLRLAMRDAKEATDTIRELSIRGTNVTSPFEEEVIPFLDDLDAGARESGKVNAILNNAGRLTGYNTSREDTGKSSPKNGGGRYRKMAAEDPGPTNERDLLAEGARAFRIFTGREAPLAHMERALYQEDQPQSDRICFIGFMGAGKSTIGPAVAAKLSIPHVDVDARIEQKAGCTIGEIFRDSGEEVFRQREKNEIRDILGHDRCVVAAGGGSVLDGENARRMKASALVVWLFAGLEETLLRIGTDPSRPLAAGKDSIEKTFRGRIPLYARTSHLLVKTDGASIDEVAERIVYESDKAFGG